jgi:hypothetical protein
LTPPSPIVTLFITKALVLSSQKPSLPPTAVTSFMDEPLGKKYRKFIKGNVETLLNSKS